MKKIYFVLFASLFILSLEVLGQNPIKSAQLEITPKVKNISTDYGSYEYFQINTNCINLTIDCNEDWLSIDISNNNDSLIVHTNSFVNNIDSARSALIVVNGDNLVVDSIYVKQCIFEIVDSLRFPGVQISLGNNASIPAIDIDQDGDYDYHFSYQNSIIRNNLNYFDTINISIEGTGGTIEWIDIDNDNAVDYSGVAGSYEYRNDIYINQNNLNFKELLSFLPKLSESSVDWCDFDNDGDLDVLLTGIEETTSESISKIYENEKNGKFTELKVQLRECNRGEGKWGDYNNDGYEDILIRGVDDNLNGFFIIYQNNKNGTFSEFFESRLNVYYDKTLWVDFDNDGDLDLVVIKDEHIENNKVIPPEAFFYEFNHSYAIVDSIKMSLRTSSIRRFLVGDIDNNGFKDFIVLQNGSYPEENLWANYIYLFLNDSGVFHIDSINFTEDLIRNEYYNNYSPSFGTSSPLVDIDNDNDLDFLLSIYDPDLNGQYYTYIIRNNISDKNSSPSIPANQNTEIKEGKLIFEWSHSVDNEESSNGLSYNIRIGSLHDSSDIVSPNADIITGFHYIQEYGNAGYDTTFILNSFPKTDSLFWNVQAIDGAYLNSNFSAESKFKVPKLFEIDTTSHLPVYKNFERDWGDFDNDGDYDLILTKNINSIDYKNELYINNNNIFNKYELNLPVGDGSKILFSDFNNDNYLDIIYFGYDINNNEDTLILLINDKSGNFNFSKSYNTGCYTYNLQSIDIDNNGSLDIVFNANYDDLGIILNNNGVFSNELLFFKLPVSTQGMKLLDFDNDFDYDLSFLMGRNDDFFYGNIFVNNELNFDSLILFTDSLNGDCEIADLNNDNMLDFIISGNKLNYGFCVSALINNGSYFKLEQLDLKSSLVNAKVLTSDFNNDSKNDILTSDAFFYTELHENIEGNFNKKFSFKDNYNQFNWVDYNSDNNLDLFANSDNGEGGIYRNNGNWQNDPPIAPDSLSVSINDHMEAIFSWNRTTDPQGGSGGLSYNMRIGTTPSGVDVMSPLSDVVTGYRRIPKMGNVQMNNGWKIKGLTPGQTYYWSVQAIDQSYLGGAWAPEQTFTVPHVIANFSADTVCHGTPATFEDFSISPNEDILSWQWEFGDGGVSNDSTPTYLYGQGGIYPVTLTIQTASHQNSITKDVLVRHAPVASFYADTVCQGTPTAFYNQSNVDSVAVSSWHWDFGDGSTFAAENPPPHGYINDSVYNSSLVITAANGCADTAVQEVIVGSLPVASLNVSGNLEFCEGDSLILSTNYIPYYQYKWLLDGLVFGYPDTNICKITQTSGSYSVRVRNIYGDCFTTSVSKVVTVNSIPQIPIIQNPSTPTTFCEGGSIELTATSIEGVEYTWMRNGVDINNSNSNTYTVTETGDYSVKVTENQICYAYSPNSVSVEVNPSPNVSQSLSHVGDTVFCYGGNVEIQAGYDPSCSYQWLKDGSYITDTTYNIVATTSGTYQAEISLGDCILLTEEQEVVVNEMPDAPVIQAASSTEFCEDESVELSTTAVSGIDYQWFRDGSPISGATQSTYTASESGSYTLRVANASDCEIFSEAIDVLVHPLPTVASISNNGATTFCEGGSVELAADYYPDYTYQWKKDGGYIAATGNVYQAEESGSYSLEVSNDNCTLETNTIDITVNPLPEVPEIINNTGETELCEGESAVLSASGQAGNTYNWLLNGGQIASGGSYEARIQGIIKLQAVNGYGCIILSNDSIEIIINELPVNPSISLQGTSAICPSDSALMEVEENTTYTYQWLRGGEEIEGATSNTYAAYEEGAYKVRVMNQQCDVITPEQSIVMLDGYDVPEIFVRGPVLWYFACSNDTAQTYRWYKDGQEIPNSNDYIYVANQNLGEYYVEISDGGQCWVMSEVVKTEEGYIDKLNSSKKLKEAEVNPNPNKGKFKLRIVNSDLGEVNINIKSSSGQKMGSQILEKTEETVAFEMDLSYLTSGVYYLEIKTQTAHYLEKVVIEK